MKLSIHTIIWTLVAIGIVVAGVMGFYAKTGGC